VRCHNEPRAAFYTEKQAKMQNKNMRVAASGRKNFHRLWRINAMCIKKSLEMGLRFDLK
jgi:hypothetical protein